MLMKKELGKTIVIQNDTLIGTFLTDHYQNCTFVFRNCTFLNFEFHSRKNAIEFSSENRFCEKMVLEASKVVIKSPINTENLDSLFITGNLFKMSEGTNLKATGEVSIMVDLVSLQRNKIESLFSLTLQSKQETLYRNCVFSGKNGMKISTLCGNMRIENTELKVTDAKVKEVEEERINGLYLSCYGVDTSMYLLGNTIKTDVLEIIHPNHMIVQNTELEKIREYGRFLSRNHEHQAQIISYSYIEPEIKLDHFYTAVEPKNKSKILELFGFTFKKGA